MLETWEAEELAPTHCGGRTQPVVLVCRRVQPAEPTPRKQWLVKGFDLPEVTERSMFCEVFGNLVARELGVMTACPALIDIPAELLALPLVENHARASRLRAGQAVGCEYHRTGWIGFGESAALTDHQHLQAARIYVTDLLLQNPDRMTSNGNCAYRGQDLLAYDFEMSFSFMLLFGSQPEPWEVTKHGLAGLHLFHKNLRLKHPDWNPVLDDLERLSDERLRTLTGWLPERWHGWAERACQHLATDRENRRDFTFELQRSIL